MNQYEKLRNRQQQEFNALPLGFAFNQEQFNEMMQAWGLDPEKDTDKIYSLAGGSLGYVQKKDAALLHETTERHTREMDAAIAGDKTGDGFIYQMFLCELRNNEYGYTGDVSDTLDTLGYTPESIGKDTRLKHGLERACKRIMGRKGI